MLDGLMGAIGGMGSKMLDSILKSVEGAVVGLTSLFGLLDLFGKGADQTIETIIQLPAAPTENPTQTPTP